MPELTDELYLREERINALTHGFGLLLSLAGAPWLLALSFRYDGPVESFGIGVFGLSMVLLYFSSTFYHSVHRPDAKLRWRKLDHICIYFLIAGTHTPFILYYLDGPVRTIYLSVLWGMVGLGILFKLFLFGRLEVLSVILYVLMGWMVIAVLPRMLEVMSWPALLWVLAGGLSYTVGVLFYVRERIPYHHGIWHVFVLAGTLAHFIGLYYSIGG